MKRAVILHGTMGSPESNWFRWLEGELRARGLEVWLPELPHPEQPSLRQSTDYVCVNAPFPLDKDTMLIGHSSGAILAFIVAQDLHQSIGAIVAVAVFSDNSLNWEANDKLFDVPFDFDAFQLRQAQLLCISSDNDPYVPLEKAQYIAKGYDAELVVIPGQGHFNLEQSEAYREFPQLLTLLEERHLI